MGLVQEFRDFAMRGNVVDMAVGVVIGGAFGKIVSSLVNDIIMPPLNLLTAKSGVNFKELALTTSVELPKLKDGKPEIGADGKDVLQMVEYNILNYGPFLQTIVDFILVAFAIFMVIKLMNNAKKRFEKDKEAAPPAAPPEDIILLREIRDSLRR